MKAVDGMKYCSSCKWTKPVEEFYKNKSKVDGLGDHCIICASRTAKAYKKTEAGILSERKSSLKWSRTPKAREAKKVYNNLMRKELSNSYIASLIGEPLAEISQERLGTYRAIVIAQRKINEYKKLNKQKLNLIK